MEYKRNRLIAASCEYFPEARNIVREEIDRVAKELNIGLRFTFFIFALADLIQFNDNLLFPVDMKNIDKFSDS